MEKENCGYDQYTLHTSVPRLHLIIHLLQAFTAVYVKVSHFLHFFLVYLDIEDSGAWYTSIYGDARVHRSLITVIVWAYILCAILCKLESFINDRIPPFLESKQYSRAITVQRLENQSRRERNLWRIISKPAIETGQLEYWIQGLYMTWIHLMAQSQWKNKKTKTKKHAILKSFWRGQKFISLNDNNYLKKSINRNSAVHQ